MDINEYKQKIIEVSRLSEPLVNRILYTLHINQQSIENLPTRQEVLEALEAIPLNIPVVLNSIIDETENMGFKETSELNTGSLLCSLAATKTAGKFLELGMGSGCGTSWMLEGMDKNSQLISIEKNTDLAAIAQKYLGKDSRLTIHIGDAEEWIKSQNHESFDMIFADTFASKYYFVDETIKLLKPGGIYIVDDLRFKEEWPDFLLPLWKSVLDHFKKREDIVITVLNWASGIMVGVKR